MNLNIRRATSADRTEWLRMRHALWSEDDLETLELDLDKMLADPLTPVFVVERSDGKLGGFIETGTRKYADGALSSPVGYIEGWYVDEDLRGQGIGKTLMQAAEDWARSIGVDRDGVRHVARQRDQHQGASRRRIRGSRAPRPFFENAIIDQCNDGSSFFF